jgi:hypothetical protein
MLEEIRNINPTRKDLRKFGITVGLVLTAITAFLLYKRRPDMLWLLSIPGLLILLGVVSPDALKSVYRIWMTMAITIQWIMTRFILTILFYLVVTPIGLINRLFHKDLLSTRFNANTSSYWTKREQEKRTLKDYERQF